MIRPDLTFWQKSVFKKSETLCRFPDCRLEKKSQLCMEDPESSPVTYTSCISSERDAVPWCYTRTHHNRSHIQGQFGYCSPDCEVQGEQKRTSRRSEGLTIYEAMQLGVGMVEVVVEAFALVRFWNHPPS